MPPLRTLWPIPTLAIGIALLAGGIFTIVRQAPPPDRAASLPEVRTAFAAREFDKAVELINTKLAQPIREGALTPPQVREVYLTRARSVSAAQEIRGTDSEANHRAIIEDYEQARKADGAALEPADQARLAESLIAIGQTAEAIELVRSSAEKDPTRRIEIYKSVISKDLARPAGPKDPDRTLGLLSEMLDDSGVRAGGVGVSEADRAWAIARQTEIRLIGGHTGEAISALQRSLVRMDKLPGESRGELLYLLGRAYNDSGDFARASEQLEAAEEALPPSHPLRAATLVMAGRIQQAAGKLEDAERRFERARQNSGGGDSMLAALLGLAETAAAKRDDSTAIENYSVLIEELGKLREQSTEATTKPAKSTTEPAHGEHPAATPAANTQLPTPPQPDHASEVSTWVTPALISASLMDRSADRRSAGDLATSLRYALMAESVVLDARREVPVSVLQAIASLSKGIGEQTLAQARVAEGVAGVDLRISDLGDVVKSEIKRSLFDAGEYYRKVAQRVSSSDEAGYRDALWNAADCFDLAGAHDDAKDAFSQYAGVAGDDDRRGKAVFRRGQILAAKRQFREAMTDFRSLVDARGLSGTGSGVLGEQAIVPLARCYVAQDTPEALKAAEDLLSPVVTDGQALPESAVYREALIELGELVHRLGRHSEAITRLTEAVVRYPTHERIGTLYFKLADASRQSAAKIDSELRESMPQSRREELTRVRTERLRQADTAYRRAMEAASLKDPRLLTAMDKLVMRNSAFFAADVAFEQGSFDRAISAYDAARLRYSEDPASLVAMVQIVNCYVAQKKWAEAISANNRAEQQLRSLPEQVWSQADLPMERKHWERWLDSKSLIAQRDKDASTAEVGADRPR